MNRPPTVTLRLPLDTVSVPPMNFSNDIARVENEDKLSRLHGPGWSPVWQENVRQQLKVRTIDDDPTLILDIGLFMLYESDCSKWVFFSHNWNEQDCWNTSLVYISWPIIITSLNLGSHLLVYLTVLGLQSNRWFMHIPRLAMAMLGLDRTKT